MASFGLDKNRIINKDENVSQSNSTGVSLFSDNSSPIKTQPEPPALQQKSTEQSSLQQSINALVKGNAATKQGDYTGILPSSDFVITTPFASPTANAGNFNAGDPHYALDIGTPVGTEIYSPGRGQVSNIDEYNGEVYINFENGYQLQLFHLDTMNVRPGDTVDVNTIIGTSGNRGYSTGPHLHLGIIDPNGNPVDPTSFYYGTANPFIGGQGASNNMTIFKIEEKVGRGAGGIGDAFANIAKATQGITAATQKLPKKNTLNLNIPTLGAQLQNVPDMFKSRFTPATAALNYYGQVAQDGNVSASSGLDLPAPKPIKFEPLQEYPYGEKIGDRKQTYLEKFGKDLNEEAVTLDLAKNKYARGILGDENSAFVKLGNNIFSDPATNRIYYIESKGNAFGAPGGPENVFKEITDRENLVYSPDANTWIYSPNANEVLGDSATVNAEQGPVAPEKVSIFDDPSRLEETIRRSTLLEYGIDPDTNERIAPTTAQRYEQIYGQSRIPNNFGADPVDQTIIAQGLIDEATAKSIDGRTLNSIRRLMQERGREIANIRNQEAAAATSELNNAERSKRAFVGRNPGDQSTSISGRLATQSFDTKASQNINDIFNQSQNAVNLTERNVLAGIQGLTDQDLNRQAQYMQGLLQATLQDDVNNQQMRVAQERLPLLIQEYLDGIKSNNLNKMVSSLQVLSQLPAFTAMVQQLEESGDEDSKKLAELIKQQLPLISGSIFAQ